MCCFGQLHIDCYQAGTYVSWVSVVKSSTDLRIYSISYYDGNVTGIQFYTAMIGRYFPCGIGFQLHKGKMKTVKRMVSFLY